MDLSPAQIRQAAAVLGEARASRTPIDRLPGSLTPLSRAEGHAIAAHVEQRSAEPLYGWKMAATSAAGRAHLDIDAPIAGRILAEDVIADGGTLRLGRRIMALAEVEFAFTLGHDLPPREGAYSVAEVSAAVSTAHPAIELPDTRLVRFAEVGVAELTADNACVSEFVLGPAAPAGWRDLDLGTLDVAIAVTSADGSVRRLTGRGSNVLDGPLDALTWIANELSPLGIALRGGQVVTTGIVCEPIPLSPGTRVHADFGPLGTVGMTAE